MSWLCAMVVAWFAKDMLGMFDKVFKAGAKDLDQAYVKKVCMSARLEDMRVPWDPVLLQCSTCSFGMHRAPALLAVRI